MIRLKDILAEALPRVPMTVGFKPTEDYGKQIPAEFLRFYNNEDGNKSGSNGVTSSGFNRGDRFCLEAYRSLSFLFFLFSTL